MKDVEMKVLKKSVLNISFPFKIIGACIEIS